MGVSLRGRNHCNDGLVEATVPYPRRKAWWRLGSVPPQEGLEGLMEAIVRTPVGRPDGGYSPYPRRKAWWRLGPESLVEARIRTPVGRPGGGYCPYPRRKAWWRLQSVRTPESLVEARTRTPVGKPGGGYDPYPLRKAWWRLQSVPPWDGLVEATVRTPVGRPGGGYSPNPRWVCVVYRAVYYGRLGPTTAVLPVDVKTENTCKKQEPVKTLLVSAGVRTHDLPGTRANSSSNLLEFDFPGAALFARTPRAGMGTTVRNRRSQYKPFWSRAPELHNQTL
ncbi:hypothetical protein Bbelb_224250 [Branchiostoma belcheri]|nr:hypothetical protein Bbelb_224250 [Branchiostoma belcheri]